MKEVDQLEFNSKCLKDNCLNRGNTGYSFKTKVLRTDELLSNLSYPVSLGLNYNLDLDFYGSHSRDCDEQDSDLNRYDN